MGLKAIDEPTRWQIIAYYKINFSVKLIAQKCGVSRHCVYTTIKNYKNTGGVRDQPRSGRRRITTQRDDNKLFRLSRSEPDLSQAALRNVWTVITPTKLLPRPLASSSTVSRRLLEFELFSYKENEKPLLSKKDKQKRLAWCIQRKNWTFEKWSSVVFSDESNFQLINRKTTPTIRRFKNEKYKDKFIKKRVQGGGGSIGFWGCITIQGTGCCSIYNGRMNSSGYIDVLENSLIPTKNLFFNSKEKMIYQQDGAPCHTAHVVKEWFNENEIELLPWPARSPDLNPIEHLWADMDRLLAKNPAKNMADLEVRLQEIWQQITVDRCAILVESMPSRIQKCISARGGYFKY